MDNYYGEKYHLDDYSSTGESGRSSAGSQLRTRDDKSKNKDNVKNRKSNNRNNNGKNNKRNNKNRHIKKQPMKKGKKIALIAASVVVVAAIVSTAGVVTINLIKEYKKNQPFKFSQGVSIAKIDIGGLSYEDALKKVQEQSMTVVKDMDLTVSANGISETFTKESFAYNFDYDNALNAAKVYSLKEQGIYDEESESTQNTETLETSAENNDENPDFSLKYTVDTSSIEKEVSSFAKKVDKKPINAKVSKFRPFAVNRFTYKDGSDGYMLEQEDLSEQIKNFIESKKRKTKIAAQVEVLVPDITLNDVKNNIVGLATATSVSTNNANGNSNMATALNACSGSVIKPGGIWSFNKCTGDSNLESNGYKKAQVISEKKLEEGIGGGICQASTTIFKCALFANMAVIERHNHYWASSYAYAGEDATIDYPNLDLKLKNTTDYQMFIECRMEGTTLKVNIYGYQEPSYDNVKVYSENYDINKGKSFKTKTTRVLYSDNKIVNKEMVCTSTYSLTDNHVVRLEDTGTFRTTVQGQVKYETEPTTAADTEAKTIAKVVTEPATVKVTEKQTKPKPALSAEPDESTIQNSNQ